MAKIFTVCLLIVGLINFLPVLAIFSVQNLESAYSINLLSNDLIILMKHRALLFGILGGYILYSVFNPIYQDSAILMSAISMVGYVILMLVIGGYNDSLFKVLIYDFVGIIFLVVACAIKCFFKAK